MSKMLLMYKIKNTTMLPYVFMYKDYPHFIIKNLDSLIKWLFHELINGFMQLTYKVFATLCYETIWLYYIDVLFKIGVE